MKKIILIICLLIVSVIFARAESVNIGWTPPTENADGTLLTDLDKYTLYYGNVSGTYTTEVDVPGNATTYTLTVQPGHYCIVMTASDTNGNESVYSNEICTDITDTMSPAKFLIYFL